MRPRNVLLLASVLVGAACGIDRVGTGLSTEPLDAGKDGAPSIIDGGPKPDTGVDAGVDTGSDATVIETDAGDAGDTGVVIVATDFPLNLLDASSPKPDDLSNPTTIDTDALTVNGGASPTPFVLGPAPNLHALLFVNHLSVGSALRVTGSHALIVIAKNDVTISNTIVAGGVGTQPGPAGGNNLGLGNYGVSAGTGGANRGGGGGGGHATAGGTGNGAAGTFGAGGPAYGNAAVPLLGGANGGAGTNPTAVDAAAPCGFGGAGGGAIQISSYGKITLLSGPSSFIDVGGAGALAGCPDNSGSGGGSGGTIVLEAQKGVFLNGGGGGLVANGGGGSSSSVAADTNPGLPGDNGTLSVNPAPGGAVGGDGGGGAGGTGAMAPKAGGNGNRGGGGGGAVGRIYIRVKSGGLIQTGSPVLSPLFTTLPSLP